MGNIYFSDYSPEYQQIMIEKRFFKFWKNVKITDSCWEWQRGTNSKGYGAVKIQNKTYSAHRVSWTLFNGDIPEGMFVCHHCDNPKCVNPEHLFIGTQKDNMQDKCKKGRHHKQKH